MQNAKSRVLFKILILLLLVAKPQKSVGIFCYCQCSYFSFFSAVTCRKVMKFGTQIENTLIINHGKFGDSNSIPLAPPTVQICIHVYANNFLTMWAIRFDCTL